MDTHLLNSCCENALVTLRISSLCLVKRCIWIIVSKFWKLARVNETKRSERARRYCKQRNGASYAA
jgi:hypothetical protein